MKADGTSIHSVFRKLPSLLEESDLLVVNDTRTIKARLFGKRPTGGKCELLLLRPLETLDRWEAMARPAKRLKTGSSFTIGGARVRITKELEEGLREVEFDGCDVEQLIERSGHVPLPPYIRRKDEKGDRRDYQTVYARQGYSVAAPTAGLHFTGRVLRDLEKKGLEIAKIRLDVGLGTFRPIVAENIDDHRMHSERYFVPEKASEQINRALKSGRRIVAVGTTVVRTLEDQGSRFGGRSPGPMKLHLHKTGVPLHDRLGDDHEFPSSRLNAVRPRFGLHGEGKDARRIPGRHRQRLPVLFLRRRHAAFQKIALSEKTGCREVFSREITGCSIPAFRSGGFMARMDVRPSRNRGGSCRRPRAPGHNRYRCRGGPAVQGLLVLGDGQGLAILGSVSARCAG